MMKQADSNKQSSAKKPPTQGSRWRSRRSRSRDRKRTGSEQLDGSFVLTIVRPGRQRPVSVGRTRYRVEKSAPRVVFQPECVICHKKILEPSSIMEVPDSHDPAHFECVLSKLKEKEELSQHQRLVYLGSSNFAVIEPVEPEKKNSPFRVVRYVYSSSRGNMQNPPGWRGSLAITPRYVIHVEKTTLQMRAELEAAERMSIKPLDSLEFVLLEQDN